MCDYSLHYVDSRPAKTGEKLVTTEFPGTVTRGFATAENPNVVACLRSGTELAFDLTPRFNNPFPDWLPCIRPGKAASNVARFRLVNADRADTHHDALEFSDGRILLLTRLCPGQYATVLQLPPELSGWTMSDKRRHSAKAS